MTTAVQIVHALYVALVVTAPALLLHAGLSRARWARPGGVAHALAVGYVALQYAFDWPCPLTSLEHWLAGRPAVGPFLPDMDGRLVVAVVVAYLGAAAVAHLAVWRRPEVA